MSLDEEYNCWYWGECNPEYVDNYLAARHDGTFVVYDTKEDNCLILAYRVNGRTKLEKILNKDNLYGFTEPLGFDTLESALDAYNWSPTETGNTLIFPGVKPGAIPHSTSRHSINQTDQLSLLRQIKHNAKLIADKDTELEQLTRQSTLLEQKLYELNCLGESLYRLLNTLDAQMKKHHDVCKSIATTPHATKAISENFMRLTARIQDIRTNMEENDTERANIEEELRSNSKRYSHLSTETQGLKREIMANKRVLVQSNPDTDLFIVNLLSKHSKQTFEVIVPQKVDNSNAKRSLQKEEDGTFIVRLNTDSDTPFVVSVCKSGTVYHFPVHKVDGGYGFDKLTCVFDSVQELTEHYTTVPFGIYGDTYGNLTLNKHLLVNK